MPIALIDLLDSRQVALRLSATNKSGALREIVQLLAANGRLDDPDRFLEELLAHEQTRPTPVENGVVLTHLRTDLVKEIVIGIGRSRQGILFNGGLTAKLIFVIGVPQRLANEYLVVVGGLARLLRDEGVRNNIRAAKIADEFIAALRPTT